MLGLGQIKEANRIRKIQAEMQKQLEQIFSTYEKSGVRVVVRGDRRIEKIEIDGEENKELRDVINDAMKEVNKKVEKQMRGQLKDLGFPGI